MSKLSQQWVPIFRAGDYGDKGSFTEADIDRIVASYQPGEHEAPVVIGHPTANGPAFGWVQGVKRQGSELVANFHQVEPQFEAMVEAGSFKKRSASFYRDNTGKITGLRHVGFLGAQPPHVKGLRDIQFADAGNEVAEVTFEEAGVAQEQQQDQTSFNDKLSAWFREKFGDAPAPKNFSEAEVDARVATAVAAAVAPLQAQLTQLTASFSETSTAAAVRTTKGRAQDAIAALKQKGKWVPAFDKMGLPVVFDELAKNGDVVEFGEGETKKKTTALQAFTEFMDTLPALVPNAPVYTGQTAGTARASKVAGINDSFRAPADPNSVALDQKVRERMTEKNLDYGAALGQVASEHPTLTVPGGAAAGAV